MRVSKAALSALLVGVFAGMACTALGQERPRSYPPGDEGQYDAYWHDRGRYDRNDRYYDPRPYDYRDRERAPNVDVGFFYDELSPYGEWVRHPRYGWVWFPRHVRAGWRPYTLGRWVGSEYGWMWMSDEPFGWATYHYGRWAWDPYVGWLWVPGTNWAPAWVAWQHGNGYIGWAPLPPQVGFQNGVGIRLGGFNLSAGIAPHDYAFVEERRFLDSRINNRIVPEARNQTIINRTRDITNYSVTNDRVINHGIAMERIEQVTGKRPERLRITNAPNREDVGVQRGAIRVFRPADTKLETVMVAPRNNAGLPQEAPSADRLESRPPITSPQADPIDRQRAPVPISVAPRTRSMTRDDNEGQFQREQKELKARLDQEQRVLDQIHRQESAQARVNANANEVAQRHAAELKAQQLQRQRAQQQLQTRQEIERQAAQASADKVQGTRKSDKAKEESDKKKGEKKDGDRQSP